MEYKNSGKETSGKSILLQELDAHINSSVFPVDDFTSGKNLHKAFTRSQSGVVEVNVTQSGQSTSCNCIFITEDSGLRLVQYDTLSIREVGGVDVRYGETISLIRGSENITTELIIEVSSGRNSFTMDITHRNNGKHIQSTCKISGYVAGQNVNYKTVLETPHQSPTIYEEQEFSNGQIVSAPFSSIRYYHVTDAEGKLIMLLQYSPRANLLQVWSPEIQFDVITVPPIPVIGLFPSAKELGNALLQDGYYECFGGNVFSRDFTPLLQSHS